jgi:hypothetical protein
MLQQKTTVIDLNWLVSCGEILLSPIRSSTANEQRTYSVFASTRFYSNASIQNLRQSIQWQPSGKIFFMFRSISNDGICTADLSRKLKRYRNLFKRFTGQALSLWLSRESFSQQLRQLQRKKRLANISRLCTGSHFQSKTALCQRRLRCYIEKHSLRPGRNRYRFMPVVIPMGSAPPAQKCDKAAYTDGLKRLYTHVCMHYKRCGTRNYHLSNDTSGGLCHIRNGQRLHRPRNIIQFFKEQLLLHYRSQKKYSLLSPVFSSDRQERRHKKRPDNTIDRPENFKTLSDITETNYFSRRRTAPYFRIPDQLFSTGRINHLSALQAAMADRIVLQMDQTTPANKIIFRNFHQCRQDADMDRDQCLRACGDNQKGTETGAFITRNTPNYKHPTFRENTAKTSTYGKFL